MASIFGRLQVLMFGFENGIVMSILSEFPKDLCLKGAGKDDRKMEKSIEHFHRPYGLCLQEDGI